MSGAWVMMAVAVIRSDGYRCVRMQASIAEAGGKVKGHLMPTGLRGLRQTKS
jgi:hypothetical protein